MNNTITFCIEGDPRTKKNSLMIAGTGKRCPVCHKPTKQWVKQSPQHDEWAKSAIAQLQAQLYTREGRKTVFPITEPVNIKAVFYMGTHRKVDLLNLLAAVDDALVSAGVIEDDNFTIVAKHDGSYVDYDKEHPRIEIEITRG